MEKIIVPKLIGASFLNLPNIIEGNLSFKIAKVQYNNEYEDNYILGQYPEPGTLIKINQTINLEINSNKNKIIKRHEFKNQLSIDKIIDYCKKEGIIYKLVNFNFFDIDYNTIFTYNNDKKKNFEYIYGNIKNKKIIYVKNLIEKNCNDINKFQNN
jgi:hypothetical protein